jgi:hypothetical protein
MEQPIAIAIPIPIANILGYSSIFGTGLMEVECLDVAPQMQYG